MSHVNFIDLSGKTFGRLTVLERDTSRKRRAVYWTCQCRCGKVASINGANLKQNRTRSCGCLARELAAARERTHGLSKDHLYKIWAGVIKRCENPREKAYKDYGERGISICREWRENFASFYQYVTGLPRCEQQRITLDRIDNDGNYEPGNVRWATYGEQRRNARTTHLITLKGRTQCISDWLDEKQINKSTFYYRLQRGWSIEKALETPRRKKHVR